MKKIKFSLFTFVCMLFSGLFSFAQHEKSYVTYSGRTDVFIDYFDDNSNEWPEGKVKDLECKIEDGKYIIDYKSKESSYAFCKTVKLDQSKDYVIEANMVKIDGSDEYGYGITFGYKDSKDNYDFIITGYGQFAVIKWKKNGRYKALVNLKRSKSINLGLMHGNNKLAIIKIGSFMNFFINDLCVAKIPLPEINGDKIGFVVNNNLHIEVRDLQIYYITTTTTDFSSIIPATYTDIDTLISDFLESFNMNSSATNVYRKTFLAPSYMNEKKMYPDKYRVNAYTIYGHSIESVNIGSGTVKTLIWGEDKAWFHRLNFTVVVENGYYYIYPSGISSRVYLAPWTSIEKNVKEE